MIIPPKTNTESDLNLLNTEETFFSTIDKAQKSLKILASKILLMLAGGIYLTACCKHELEKSSSSTFEPKNISTGVQLGGA